MIISKILFRCVKRAYGMCSFIQFHHYSLYLKAGCQVMHFVMIKF